jgi:hypothetical protein
MGCTEFGRGGRVIGGEGVGGTRGAGAAVRFTPPLQAGGNTCRGNEAARHHLGTTSGRQLPTKIAAEGGEGAPHSPDSGGLLPTTSLRQTSPDCLIAFGDRLVPSHAQRPRWPSPPSRGARARVVMEKPSPIVSVAGDGRRRSPVLPCLG